MMKTRHENDMTDHIGPLYVEKKLNRHDQSHKAWSMMKSKHENEVIDYTGTVYDENETGQ